jgi:hypothetical protein
VSFPLWHRPAPVLAITAHFFECIPEGSPEPVLLAHQLDEGGHYETGLTTAGGFYRYRLFDLAEVIGFYHQAPLLHFVAKAGQVYDFLARNERKVL